MDFQWEKKNNVQDVMMDIDKFRNRAKMFAKCHNDSKLSCYIISEIQPPSLRGVGP